MFAGIHERASSGFTTARFGAQTFSFIAFHKWWFMGTIVLWSCLDDCLLPCKMGWPYESWVHCHRQGSWWKVDVFGGPHRPTQDHAITNASTPVFANGSSSAWRRQAWLGFAVVACSWIAQCANATWRTCDASSRQARKCNLPSVGNSGMFSVVEEDCQCH